MLNKMAFPFSATKKENFPKEEINIISERKVAPYLEMYTKSIDQKIVELSGLGIEISKEVEFVIYQNLYLFDRLNINILFIACSLYLNNSYRSTSSYSLLFNNILSTYPNINETKLDFEISTYLDKIIYVRNGGFTPYLRF